MGQANFVTQYDADQTLRTYADCATVGADNDEAYSTDNIIQEGNIRAKPAADLDDYFLGMHPKLENGRNDGRGEEKLCTANVRFTGQTLTEWMRLP